MGNDSLLAFFEIPKGEEPAGNRNAIGAMQHCAFVVTAERFREVEARLKSHGIDYIGAIAQIPGLFGIYFYDPNGIRLEFTCQPDDGEAPAVISCVTRTKAEARDEPATLRASRPSGSKCASPHCAGDKSGFSGVAVSVRLPTSASSFRTPPETNSCVENCLLLHLQRVYSEIARQS
jgi:hypothetical protein